MTRFQRNLSIIITGALILSGCKQSNQPALTPPFPSNGNPAPTSCDSQKTLNAPQTVEVSSNIEQFVLPNGMMFDIINKSGRPLNIPFICGIFEAANLDSDRFVMLMVTSNQAIMRAEGQTGGFTEADPQDPRAVSVTYTESGPGNSAITVGIAGGGATNPTKDFIETMIPGADANTWDNADIFTLANQ